MRILLISDTHGDLRQINERVEETGTDAVLHAGDLGLYDEGSAGRLSPRELILRILHSDLPLEEKKAAKKLKEQALRDFVADSVPLSQLPEFLAGRERFAVPVYAVWGNHEDLDVVSGLMEGRLHVPNLILLDGGISARLGNLRLFGLGGNLLLGRKLFHRPISGGGGRVWTTLAQIGALLQAASEPPAADEVRLLITHVSPGKEPLIGRLAVHLGAQLAVSGHMGAPFCTVWNEFAIREAEAARAWLDSQNERVEELWREIAPDVSTPAHAEAIERGMRLVRELPENMQRASRGRREPDWYRRTFFVNLPDAVDGYAVLSVEEGKLTLETTGAGMLRQST